MKRILTVLIVGAMVVLAVAVDASPPKLDVKKLITEASLMHQVITEEEKGSDFSFYLFSSPEPVTDVAFVKTLSRVRVFYCSPDPACKHLIQERIHIPSSFSNLHLDPLHQLRC